MTWELRGVTLATGDIAFVQIEGQSIVGISDRSEVAEGVDCSGLSALPGLIDSHVHLRFPGWEHKEDWDTGSRAALAGGVTTVGDMPNSKVTTTTYERFLEKVEQAKDAPVDVRFWFGATEHNFPEIRRVASHPKLMGNKVFMGSSTGDLLVTSKSVLREIFEISAETGVPVGVHAESENRMKANYEQVSNQRGGESYIRLTDHSRIRTVEVEVDAILTALELQKQTGCKLYLCHVSTMEGVRLAKAARDQGRPVYVEICIHHLILDEEKLAGPDGARFKVNPPLRSKSEVNQLRFMLFRGGCVDTLATDHAPHTTEEKNAQVYKAIPSGMPGVQTLLPLAYRFVREGWLTIGELINLTSSKPAEIFGLATKGVIGPGFDADITLIDPKAEFEIRDEDQVSKCRWTPYHGMQGVGRVEMVVARGMLHDFRRP